MNSAHRQVGSHGTLDIYSHSFLGFLLGKTDGGNRYSFVETRTHTDGICSSVWGILGITQHSFNRLPYNALKQLYTAEDWCLGELLLLK